ncbi:MAG: hypothetical protein ABDH21_04850 [bacterium]
MKAYLKYLKDKKLMPKKLSMWVKLTTKYGFSIRSYSQEGEDLIFHRIFERKSEGFYVDVGAHHPY